MKYKLWIPIQRKKSRQYFFLPSNDLVLIRFEITNCEIITSSFIHNNRKREYSRLTESYNIGKLNSEDIFTSTHRKKKSQTDALN